MGRKKTFGRTLSVRYPVDVFKKLEQEAEEKVRTLNEQATYWTIKGMQNDNELQREDN